MKHAYLILAPMLLAMATACSVETAGDARGSAPVAVPEAVMQVIDEKLEPQALAAVSDFDDIQDEDIRSAAIFTEMGKVLTHPRCMNCHPAGDSPLQGENGMTHQPPVQRGPADFGVTGMQCNTCHGEETVPFMNGTGSIPGHPHWMLAPIEMAWTDKNLTEICEQLKDTERNGDRSLEDIHEHNANDTLVGYGWSPGPGREPAPGTQAEFGALTKAWIETGAICPTSG